MEYSYKVTTNGRAVMAACMALEKPPHITRVAFGSGKVDEETNLADVHEMLEYVCDGAVAERGHEGDRFNLTIQYANIEHKEVKAFLLSEFIVFAEDPAGGGETDLLYGSLGDYRQPVPAYNPAYPPSVFNFPLTLILSDALQPVVSAPAGLVTHDEFSLLRDQTVEGMDKAEQAIAGIRQRIVNPNLLDNPDFTNPINQRGVSGTISTPGYFLDRWKLTSGSVTISSGGITLNGTIQQILETAPSGTLTASYLTDSGVQKASYDSASKTFSITASNTLIKAAKLELGSVQTLAHQEDGNWVLNDPPPNQALELAKCQRYQLAVGAHRNGYTPIGSMITYKPNIIKVMIPLPASMRNNPPTVSVVGNLRLVYKLPGESSSKTVSISSENNITAVELSNNYLFLEIHDVPLEANAIGWLDKNGKANYLLIDNNL